MCKYVGATYFENIVKDDRTPVTIADFAVQAVITALLAEKYPSVPMMCTSTRATHASIAETSARLEYT